MIIKFVNKGCILWKVCKALDFDYDWNLFTGLKWILPEWTLTTRVIVNIMNRKFIKVNIWNYEVKTKLHCLKNKELKSLGVFLFFLNNSD